MKKFGTREDVIKGLSKQTRGGLTKQFLKYNAEGKIISVRRRKQRGGSMNNFKYLKYNGCPLCVTTTSINYNEYIKCIYKIINKNITPTKSNIYILENIGLGQTKSERSITYYYLTNILTKNDTSPTIFLSENYNSDPKKQIDILTQNETFYTIAPYKCEESPNINAIIKNIQESTGGNPSSIQTGSRGGRFVVIGGRKRYLRK